MTANEKCTYDMMIFPLLSLLPLGHRWQIVVYLLDGQLLCEFQGGSMSHVRSEALKVLVCACFQFLIMLCQQAGPDDEH